MPAKTFHLPPFLLSLLTVRIPLAIDLGYTQDRNNSGIHYS